MCRLETRETKDIIKPRLYDVFGETGLVYQISTG